MAERLSEAERRGFREAGYCGPLRVMSADEAGRYRAALERFERRWPARTLVELPVPPSALLCRHVRTSLQDVDLGFAGRRDTRHPIHRAITNLSPGDPLKARITEQGRWELLNTVGSLVGRLAKNFQPPPGMRCRSAEVLAVVGWSREASEPRYRDSIRCDAWEVVVPELVFEPLEG